MSLRFSLADLEKEAKAFLGLASSFLNPGSDRVVYAAVAQLAAISKSHSGPRTWRIDESSPLVTKTSYGEYERDGRGSLCVFGEISFKWELEPERKPGNYQPAKEVRLSGAASTKIRLMEATDQGPEKELAVWRMEVADDASPGTFFHVQVLGREGDKVFPKALDIPRLPGVLNSPFACMEFVLCELFQEEWRRIAQKETAAGRLWRGIQAHRHERHLVWALRKLSESSGSPWVAWKVAQPDEDLFMPA